MSDLTRIQKITKANSDISELLIARNKLQMAMQKCRSLEEHLLKTGNALQSIAEKIPSLEVAFEPMRSHRKILDGLADNIDKATAPASAVLKVFDAMHDLEKSLIQGPADDLVGYIGLISRLEDAISFLSKNCPMAIEWLEDLVEFLENNEVLHDDHMKRISLHFKDLKACQTSGDVQVIDGGLLSASLDRLEAEFETILSKQRPPLLSSANGKVEGAYGKKLSPQVLKNLHSILQNLISRGRKERCIKIYVDARIGVVKNSLNALPLDYLKLKSASKLDWQTIGKHIGPWTQHIEMIAKSVCESEYRICGQVLQELVYEEWEQSFGNIARSSGVLELMQFGEVVTKSRDDPEKLFKLLVMFEAMNNLRPTFAKLFGGQACKDIHQKTKELLKLIVQRAHDTFLELKQQVEKQREIQPSLDGSFPKVCSFVLSYVKHLVGDFYGPIFSQVLAISDSWKTDGTVRKSTDSLLSREILYIMNTLVVNIQEWANSYKANDPDLFHLFLCSNQWYLAVNSRVPGLKSILGDSWIRDQQQQAEVHMQLYIKEGWAKIVQHLSILGITTFTGSRAAARDLLRSKLKAFNGAFDDLYDKYSKWYLPDAELREKMCTKVIKVIVPVYRTYLQSYGPLLEQDGSKSKYVKYSAQTLERILGSMFQGSLMKMLSPSDKIKSGSTAVAQPATVSVV